MKLRCTLHRILVIWGKEPYTACTSNRVLLQHVHTYSRFSMAHTSIPEAMEQARLLGLV